MQLTPHYLAEWPDVDFELCTAFKFDGVAALQAHEIDVLITPDPIDLPELLFTPVFGYELVLVVHEEHPLAASDVVEPQDLVGEDLITVPVTLERLDIYSRFFVPAECRPRRHRTAETTELMLQLVAAKRCVSVLPDWLVRDEGAGLPIRTLRLGQKGLFKNVNVGVRDGEKTLEYIAGFLQLAREMGIRAGAEIHATQAQDIPES